MTGLFSPIVIKNVTLESRLVMPPMALDIAGDQGQVTNQLIVHYAQRVCSGNLARGEGQKIDTGAGIGLVIVEHSYINISGKAHPNQLGIDQDFLIPGLHMLVEQLHQGGIPVGIQISHAGARALQSPSAPSQVVSPYLKRFGIQQTQNTELPRELAHDEIELIVQDFVQAAIRAKKAGFDMIEIHGAHGYLLNQFYSPLTNQRTDQYGGCLENRLRLPVQVVAAVRTAVGNDFPLFYRLGADDRMDEGNSIEDSCKAAPLLVEAGIDCLDLSGGICGYLKSGPQGFFMYMAEALKKVTKIPVMVTGGIHNAFTADTFIRENKTDLVGVGRALLEDPDWARKAWSDIGKKTRTSKSEG